MVLRQRLMTKLVPTFPLPGIYFFDARRIRPKFDIPLHISAGLTAVDLTHDEEMPQEPDAPDTTQVDRLLQRQAVLTARAEAKTAAECAMEVSHVVQLTEALLEAEAVIEESTAARHHYLNVQKEHEDNLEQQGGHKRRATGSTRRRTPAPEAPLPIHLLSHEGSPELPRTVVDKVLGNLQHLPDFWPLIRFDLMLHNRPATMPFGDASCISMSICGHSHRRLLMQPLMSMHEGLLSIWCSSWLSGSSWPWSLPGNHKGSCTRLSLPS